MWLQIAGNAEDLRKAADDLDVLMESNRQIYLERINISEEELIEMLENETYLTPEQAVEMGFADEINSKSKTNPDETFKEMQQNLTQMRKMLAEQKSFRNELLELHKGAKQKDDADEEDGDKDDDKDGNEDDQNNDDENKQQKDQKDPKQHDNKISIAALLAAAATKNLKK